MKRTDVVDNWAVFDSARSLNNDLKWNTAELEGSAPVEFLSDGFQLKNTYGSTNASGGTYIYAAFAAKPNQSAIDSLVDSPSQTATPTDTGIGNEVVGNYATLNPLDNPGEAPYGNQGAAVTNGNLDFGATGGLYALRRATIQIPSSGKWYMECTVNGTGYSPRGVSSQASGFGLCKSNVITDGNAPITDGNTLWLGDSGYANFW